MKVTLRPRLTYMSFTETMFYLKLKRVLIHHLKVTVDCTRYLRTERSLDVLRSMRKLYGPL